MTKTVEVKIASASLNQTVVNFTRNVPNILSAIDAAIADGADILSLQELGLTGYTGDDYFKWIRSEAQQQELIELVQLIADYANEKNPNLVISLGFPFFYADKSQPVKINVGTEEKPALVDNSLYNIGNRPFNAVATLSGGRIQAISAKSIQPDGAAEYEPRQFLSWPDYMGATEVKLYNGQTVPFGKVVIALGNSRDQVTMYHEICAEGWPGIYDDGTINQKEQQEGRYINRLVQKHDISLVINPSASKPEPFINKPALRATLCASGSEICNGAGYVYTNVVGNEAGAVAFEGGAIFAQNGQVTYTGERYSMADIMYSSAVMKLKFAEKGSAHKFIAHDFVEHVEKEPTGMSAEWEKISGRKREFEEITRNTTLWMRDYLKKSGQQGFFISLSGGQDSAFGAVMISQMIDLNIKQLADSLGDKQKAVAEFINQFDNLEYAKEVIKINSEKGAAEATKFIKSKMLTCSYFPGENSSEVTENAARFLIEGGRLRSGKKVEGIGGTFHVINVQGVIDTYLEAYSGVDKKGLTPKQNAQVSKEIKEFIKGDKKELSPDVLSRVSRRVPTWANKKDDLLLQNIQARARLPMAWLFGNDENKIACVTSNWSEAVAGYWTFGGDGHMGSINIAGGVPKSDLRKLLVYLEKSGLNGLDKIPSLKFINKNKASAELRPLKNGKIDQFDEDDIMQYEQLDAIARSIFIGKNNPVQAYKNLLIEQPKFPDGKNIFRSKEELISCIEECCWRWHGSQFKRVASVIAPFLGENVDPHNSVRTTILSDGFRTGRAMLKLEYLKETLGGEAEFDKHVGQSFSKFKINTTINKSLRDAVMYTPVQELKDKITNENFGIETTPKYLFISGRR